MRVARVVRDVMRAAVVLVAFAPSAAHACASCISSPFGDQSYNWPYLVLILIPFVVFAAIGAVFVRVTGVRAADARAWLTAVLHPVPPDAPQEETT
jgi:hypothetical protein